MWMLVCMLLTLCDICMHNFDKALIYRSADHAILWREVWMFPACINVGLFLFVCWSKGRGGLLKTVWVTNTLEASLVLLRKAGSCQDKCWHTLQQKPGWGWAWGGETNRTALASPLHFKVMALWGLRGLCATMVCCQECLYRCMSARGHVFLCPCLHLLKRCVF